MDDGLVGLGVAEFFAHQPFHGLGVVAERLDLRVKLPGNCLLLLDLLVFQQNVRPHPLVFLDQRQVGPHDQQQNRHDHEQDDHLRELAPNTKINLHAPSLTRSGLKVKVDFIGKCVGYDKLPKMFKPLFLIFEPAATWEKIAQARRSFVYLLTTHLLPLILLGSVVEGWGVARWGKWQPTFDRIRNFSRSETITFEVIYSLLLMGVVLVCALLLLKVSQTFFGRNNYREAFTTIAYSFSPLLLLRLLDAAPMMSPWASWMVGILLTVWILYQGIPRVMQPDPTHAFGLYLSTIIVTVLVSGLVRVLTGLYLLGNVDFQHSWLTHYLAR